MENEQHFTVERKHKDRLFVNLFSYKENALSLFNAVNDTNYTDIDNLKIVTLENALYLTMKNDVAVLFHDSIDLFEQQSTINKNMPLRGFFYAAREYEEWLIKNELDKRIYGTKLVKIPAPEYFVMCNADKAMPEMWDEKLSDAFIKPSPGYEWTAHMININAGHNKTIMSRCKALDGYAIFVQMVRDNQSKGMTLEDAIKQAVDECIDKGILKTYFMQHKTEVFDMILYEFDEKAYADLMREEGEEIGTKKERINNIKSIMRSLKTSAKHAMDILNISPSEQKKYLPLLQN